jgi:hypothetical protein
MIAELRSNWNLKMMKLFKWTTINQNILSDIQNGLELTHFKLKESIGWGKNSILYASTQKKNFRFRKPKFKLRWICRLKQSVSDQKKYESKKLLLDTLTNVCLASRHRIHQNLSRQSKSRLSKIENKIFKLSLKNSFSPLYLRQREVSQNNNFLLFSKWYTNKKT